MIDLTPESERKASRAVVLQTPSGVVMLPVIWQGTRTLTLRSASLEPGEDRTVQIALVFDALPGRTERIQFSIPREELRLYRTHEEIGAHLQTKIMGAMQHASCAVAQFAYKRGILPPRKHQKSRMVPKGGTMKILSLVLTAAVALPGIAQHARPVQVKPHVRKNGTVVQPHVRTSPNKTDRDNYETQGNVNPYTGKEGKKAPKK